MAIYLLSAYTLAALVVGHGRQASEARALIGGSRAINAAKAFAKRNEYVRRYMGDAPLRVRVSLYAGLALNALYASLKAYTALRYASAWFGAEAAFYLVLGVTRFLMLLRMRHAAGGLKAELRAYRLCGAMIFALNAALTGIVFQMIHQGGGVRYDGPTIYLAAAFTFTFLAVSAYDVVGYRRLSSPVLSAAKAIALIQALVAMYSLQISMFASFGDDEGLELIMNNVFGGLLCAAIFGIALYMVLRGHAKLRRMG